MDPDSQMRINIPEGQTISGDELPRHSTTLRIDGTCMALNAASLKGNTLERERHDGASAPDQKINEPKNCLC